MKRKKITALTMALFLSVGSVVTGCGDSSDTEKPVSDVLVETVAETASGPAASASPTPAAASGSAVSPIKTLSPDRYVHGSEGYYDLKEEGINVRLRSQTGGTCWIFAASLCMETGAQVAHGKDIELDPMSLVNKVYDENRKEGYYPWKASPISLGGCAFMVIQTLANGFDGYVLDAGIELPDIETETIQKYMREYGAVYFAVPDSVSTKKGNHEGYTTLNHVTEDEDDYDHAIAAVGWDNHFPKTYFNDVASQDGAWLTVNSQASADYYYVSYDTRPDNKYDKPVCMSITDEYTYVASHDGGVDPRQSIKKKGGVTTANVFHKKGTLAAVGTYSLKKDQEIKIEIYDADFKQCIYTQDGIVTEMGYQVIELAQPVEVDDYAIAVTYSSGKAPVEGKGWLDKEGSMRFKTTSKKGESFVKIGKKWYDLHEKATLAKLGRKKKINNACIKGLYS